MVKLSSIKETDSNSYKNDNVSYKDMRIEYFKNSLRNNIVQT
jgi:hypothetical protein